MATASQVLSNFTQLAGVVTRAAPQATSITQIEFVGLSDNRVLVVLVTNDREVQNRIIHLDRHHSADELRARLEFPQRAAASAAASSRRAPRSCAQLQEARETMNALMLEAITMAQQAVPAGRAGRRSST